MYAGGGAAPALPIKINPATMPPYAPPITPNPLGGAPTGLFGIGMPNRMQAGGPGGLVRPAVMPPMPMAPAPVAPVLPAAAALPTPTPQAAVTNALMGQRRTIQPVARGVSTY